MNQILHQMVQLITILIHLLFFLWMGIHHFYSYICYIHLFLYFVVVFFVLFYFPIFFFFFLLFPEYISSILITTLGVTISLLISLLLRKTIWGFSIFQKPHLWQVFYLINILHFYIKYEIMYLCTCFQFPTVHV